MGLVHERYTALVASGELTEDTAQLSMTKHYDDLLIAINERQLSQKSSPLGWLFGKRRNQQQILRGLYVYGEVGRGKTMLMDLFFSCLPLGIKRRAHFNDFMADVHDRITRHRQAFNRGETKESDPIGAVAASIKQEAWVLCFDEFTVTDIADAMVLSRLFTALFNDGVLLIATSNVAPDNLYYNGLNRQLFLPFIEILKEHVDVINLDAKTDYRLEKVDRQPVYLYPFGRQTDEKMNAAWKKIVDGHEVAPQELHVLGHTIEIPQASGAAARFNFVDLCEKPYAALDFMELVKHYRTIFIDNIPFLDNDHRNETKRFILLIDTLYDHHVRLFASAAAKPDQLYKSHVATTETFEFDRTASRLFEMQSDAYLQAWAEGDPRNQP